MNITEIFGSNVFNESVMRERLPKKVFAEVMDVMAHGGQISMTTADIVANEMKDWAVEKGATHYTHWFQPLTGTTAEKHDSFITLPVNGKTLLQLTGKQLIMGEPDASSFPSGGLRATAYARGYTAWDITSPAFVKEMSAGNVLCIPTIFVSYSGEALDTKLPLLRSMEAISEQSLRILRLFGNTTARRVYPNVGPEQEYFLVDRNKYLTRRDLIYCGRTLFGAPAPKGQELDDQYFGVIRERVGAFMKDLNNELWKLGITATTQHNEVAPAQHEMAPIFSVCNVAVDQNQLTMETMKRVATRHGLVCLLHEKPYAGVNGSGKHNNWSISTDTGENLMEPGDDPKSNLQFQLVLACILKAVDVHAALLRQSASNVGNDLRLGAQEAPPAIISIFLGDQLDEMVHNIVNGTEEYGAGHNALDSGVSTVPVLMRDATDRNRTSPFAFTGNKFEFRMVGSSDSIAAANTTLNAIVAEAFSDAADVLEGAEDFERACKALIKQLMTDHQRIVFNGDGYSDAWVEEAARRGLPNIPSMVDAIPALIADSTIALFGKFNIFSKVELESRYEILHEGYAKKINIEAQTMLHMVPKHYIPAVIRYTTELASSIASVRSACPEADVSVQTRLLNRVSALLTRASNATDALQDVTARTNALENTVQMAHAFHDQVVPAMAELRCAIDELELLVDKDYWPVPTYGDLMFEV
ncbi:MAG: glutamine synthetase III [Oscillospiraceae bacterium]|nr:glutamine synthetase III [Oscillospiraceae bacterium]